jgi:hypothetical protein
MLTLHSRSKPLLLMVIILSFVLAACTTLQAQPGRITKIAILNYLPALDPAIEAFKASLKEAGLVDGASVLYLYNGIGLYEVTNGEEVLAALPSLTKGTDAILQIPLPFLIPSASRA